MENPVRILHVLGGTGLGGAESRIMDLYRQMDREEIQFDFLVHGSADRKPQFYDEEIRKMGGHIYVLPKFRVYNYFAYRKAICAFFEEHHEFRLVQGHMTSTASIYLPLAKCAGVPVTVAHSRNAGVEKGPKGLATKILRKNLYRKADYCFACSALAGIDVFGKAWFDAGNVKVIHNAIDAARFTYQPQVRDKMRRQLHVEDKLVLGHVGRFQAQKNHPYLIEICAALCKRRNDVMLCLLGEGPDRESIEKKCVELGIRENVIFAGNQKRPEDYYQAFDFFLLPSLYEGLPGVLVEAQAAGLRCLVSDTVTREAQATDLVTYLGTDGAADVWAKEILAQERYDRRDTYQEMVNAGFDVKTQADGYRKFYLQGELSGL